MRHLLRTLVVIPAVLLLFFPLSGRAVQASGGNATAQTVGVYRSVCSASVSGVAVGTARFSADDQGGIPGGAEIRIGLTAALTRTTYTVSILTGSCQVLASAGSLVTDDSGRGDLDVHVAGTAIPSGAALSVELVAPGDTLASPAVAIAGL